MKRVKGRVVKRGWGAQLWMDAHMNATAVLPFASPK